MTNYYTFAVKLASIMLFLLISVASNADFTVTDGETLRLGDGSTFAVSGKLSIKNGKFEGAADATIIIGDSWENSGTFTPNQSSVVFTGNSDPVFVKGNNTF